jgi:hypothetical protein
MRKVVQPILIASTLALGAGAAPAAASTIDYVWTGTVTDVVPGTPPVVAVGQKIGITLTLDNAVPDQDASPNRGIYDQQQQLPNLVVAVNIGGVTNIGSFQFGTVLDDDQGVDEFKIETGDQQIGTRFVIDFKTSNLGVLSSDSLPLSIDPQDFELASFSVNPDIFLPLASAPRFGGTIDFVGLNLTQTPLPGSAVMFVPALVALLGIGGWKRRRFKTWIEAP